MRRSLKITPLTVFLFFALSHQAFSYSSAESHQGVSTSLKGVNVVRNLTLSGGRSGQLVKNLTGPANSVIRGSGGRAFLTNKHGQVILDITRTRVKPVIPGQGFGLKRPPTAQELKWLDQLWP